MSDLDPDDLQFLDAVMAAAVDSVTPPDAVKKRVLSAARRSQRPRDESVPSPAQSRTLRAHEGEWLSPIAGIRMRRLSEDTARKTVTFLLDLAPGSLLPAHDHHGSEDAYVVSGSCRIGAVALDAGDFHRVDAGAHHGDVVSEAGCVLLLTVDAADWHAA